MTSLDTSIRNRCRKGDIRVEVGTEGCFATSPNTEEPVLGAWSARTKPLARRTLVCDNPTRMRRYLPLFSAALEERRYLPLFSAALEVPAPRSSGEIKNESSSVFLLLLGRIDITDNCVFPIILEPI